MKNIFYFRKEIDYLQKTRDGSPKVFYRGTGNKGFKVFRNGSNETGREGIYFSNSANISKTYL